VNALATPIVFRVFFASLATFCKISSDQENGICSPACDHGERTRMNVVALLGRIVVKFEVKLPSGIQFVEPSPAVASTV
jgi:hypothetical protein